MNDILTLDTIQVQAKIGSKEDAIRTAGELLVKSGCVKPAYVDSMLEREKTMSTYVGNGVSIPHGEFKNLGLVNRTGISVLQVPEGVEWLPGDTAYLIVGIAATGDEHIKVLQNLALVVEDLETAELLAKTTDPELILEKLNRPVEEE
jgi:mannitol/fructose-specific phosphotransferase system IIA component